MKISIKIDVAARIREQRKVTRRGARRESKTLEGIVNVIFFGGGIWLIYIFGNKNRIDSSVGNALSLNTKGYSAYLTGAPIVFLIVGTLVLAGFCLYIIGKHD